MNRQFFITFILLLVCSFCFGLEDFLTVYTETDEDGAICFYADNEAFIPVFVKIEFDEKKNLEASTDLPYSIAVPGKTENFYLFKMTQKRKNKGYSYSYIYTYCLGDPLSASHDDDYLYLLPFEHGTKHQVTQGYFGRFTHFGDYAYAVDFDLDEGTPVYAARGGIIVDIKEDSNTGGSSPSYEKHGNYVLIYHEDGTFGNYAHFMFNGVVVEVGDTVAAGDLIGYSGNTGQSSGPHLHFDVRIPTLDGKMVTIPVKFYGLEGEPISLEEGYYYYAFHPGNSPFPVLFGQDITNEDYSDYREEVLKTGKLEIRTEQVDNTLLFFLKNGTDKRQSIFLEFDLTNLEPSKDIPLEMEVPALTEMFLLFLRVKEVAEAWRYSYQYSYMTVRQ